MGFQLSGHKSGSIPRRDIVSLIHVHPADGNGRPASATAGVGDGHLNPDAFGVKELQLDHPRLEYQLVLEDLACQVVAVTTAKTLLWALTRGLDLLLVVLQLDAEAAVLELAVAAELIRDALQHRTA